MYFFLVPTVVTIATILTEIMLNVYRRSRPEVKPSGHWAATLWGLIVVISVYLMNIGIGIKVAKYLFG